jgi:hypothetical protein
MLVYGSADPYPNPAELLLTQLVASLHRLKWRFFVYQHGKNLNFLLNEETSLPPEIFPFEYIIPETLTLGKMAEEIWRLRQEPAIVCHLPNGSVLRATSDPFRKWSGGWAFATISQLHQAGGWLGGSAVHFILRLWAEDRGEVLYICPFQEKGRVYEIYRGFSRPLFITTPFVRFVPPARLGLPSWSPAPWSYWKTLPANFRRRVRKEVMRQLKKKKSRPRIEISIP